MVGPEDFLTSYLGPIIFRLRKKRSMTQKELADAIGIHETTLGKIEAGKGRVRPDLAESLCSALGESSEEIIARAIEDLKLDYKKRSTQKAAARPSAVEEEDILQDSKGLRQNNCVISRGNCGII